MSYSDAQESIGSNSMAIEQNQRTATDDLSKRFTITCPSGQEEGDTVWTVQDESGIVLTIFDGKRILSPFTQRYLIPTGGRHGELLSICLTQPTDIGFYKCANSKTGMSTSFRVTYTFLGTLNIFMSSPKGDFVACLVSR